jgi:hypothetical protein
MIPKEKADMWITIPVIVIAVFLVDFWVRPPAGIPEHHHIFMDILVIVLLIMTRYGRILIRKERRHEIQKTILVIAVAVALPFLMAGLLKGAAAVAFMWFVIIAGASLLPIGLWMKMRQRHP